MKKTMYAIVFLALSISMVTLLSSSVFGSTELINYTGMTTSEINTFIGLCADQGFSDLIIRLNAMYEWDNGAPSSSAISKSKQIIAAANDAGIQVSIDLHTWYTTWDSYFRDSASNSASNRAKYLNYVANAIDAFNGYNVKAWMVLNEPQARSASNSENNFILDIIRTAKQHTNKPISVRFMGGYSPTTGHYSSSIDQATDFLCRNVYWDPRNPSRSVYGTTESKMNDVIAYAKNHNKELWITEFGSHKDNLEDQRAYVAAFVEYANEKGIDHIFCWASQPESGSGEIYNIFNGYSPNPAFYELAKFKGSTNTSSSSSSTNTGSSSSTSDNTSSDSSSSTDSSSSSSSDSTYSNYWSSRRSRYYSSSRYYRSRH